MKNAIWVVAGACALALAGSVCEAGVKQHKSDVVPVVEQSVDPRNVRDLGGFVGYRFDLNEENRLKTFDIDTFVKMVEKKETDSWFWIGEQPGKWLEAAIYSTCVTGDKELIRKSNEMMNRLIAAQEPNGYMGITSTALRTKTIPYRGMDPYELYFTIHALISAYEEQGSFAALNSARKLCDFFVSNVGTEPGQIQFRPDDYSNGKKHSLFAGHTVHSGWEGAMLIEPIMRLYQTTGDKKYLDWTKMVLSNMDDWSHCNSYSNLKKVAAGKMQIHEVQPYVHSHTFQMVFEGLIRLYQSTGDKQYLNIVDAAWNDIASRQMFITGTTSVREHYEPGHNLPNTGSVCETCSSMSWMDLCQMMLETTGDTKYADVVEKLMFNHTFATQTFDGEGFRYHTAPNGTKPWGYYTGPDCCSSSGARMIAKLPRLIYARGKNSIYVNQFVASSAEFDGVASGKVAVKQVTSYPETDSIKIEVSPAKPSKFTLYVRVPKWCEKPSITVGGQAVARVVPGKYAAITRKWKQGDVVEVKLPMQAQWVKGEYTSTGFWALTRGPEVYMLDSTFYTGDMRGAMSNKTYGRDSAELGGVVIDPANPKSGIKEVKLGGELLGPGLQVQIVLPDGTESSAVMLPFANLGKWWVNDQEKKTFLDSLKEEQDWRKRPAISHPYAIWVVDSTSPALAALRSR